MQDFSLSIIRDYTSDTLSIDVLVFYLTVFVHRCTMYHHAKIIRRFTFKRLIVSISFYFHFDFSFLWILLMHGNESRQQHKVKCQPQQTLANTDWQ